MFTLLLLTFVVAASAAASDSVVVLSTKNFVETVKNPKDDMGWMVKFYAPWCGEFTAESNMCLEKHEI